MDEMCEIEIWHSDTSVCLPVVSSSGRFLTLFGSHQNVFMFLVFFKNNMISTPLGSTTASGFLEDNKVVFNSSDFQDGYILAVGKKFRTFSDEITRIFVGLRSSWQAVF